MDKTIRQIPVDKCTGCGACYNKCPVDAITMEYNEEGFLFPKVSDGCVNCGQCLNVCPAAHPLPLHERPDSYAVWASDDIRLKSSSGGMFSLLASYVLKHHGVVCGAAYTDQFQSVHHIWAEDEEGLAPLRGSKYVQSDTERTYREAKQYLDQGRMVLYTGCPCQIAALYRYLGKDHENLYTADLVCHGSNSVKAYQSFIREFSGGQEIEKVDFRDKKYYSWSTPTVIYLKNGDVKKAAWNESVWNKGFLEGVHYRLNCAACPYAREERVADITMADCWQVHRIDPSYDDRKGTSLVLVNSPKGRQLFDKLRRDMKLCRPVPLEEMRKYNGQLRGPSAHHPSRKFFFSHLDRLGYHKALWYGRGMRFDVGMVGWWFASNYGSSLTYYALGTVLENMGRQVLMVPVAKVDGTPWEKEIQFTVDFLKKHFHIGRDRGFDKMHEFNQFCDSFMLGSDQMWTVSSTHLVGYTFFLDFVDKDKKKIAFSTSFGQNDYDAPEEMLATASDFLKRFDKVSVREQRGVEICRDRLGVQAEQIFDPVFLCRTEDYDRLAEEVHDPIHGKYLLCYILDPTPEKEAAARAIAEHEGLQIKTIVGLKEYDQAKDRWHTGTVLPRVSAEQFLYYIKNCSYLLTDSHHGTCFGIIYKKPYAALVNAGRGSTRFETVADVLGLKDRLFYDPAEIPGSERPYGPIDYEQVEQALAREKERAMEWLVQALECPTVPAKDTIHTVTADLDRQIIGISNRCNAMERRLKDQQEKNDREMAALRADLDAIRGVEPSPKPGNGQTKQTDPLRALLRRLQRKK